MILLIDNYDSFTYNLVQYLGEISEGHSQIRVIRNDVMGADQLLDLKPSHIIISPGPCTPNEAGVSVELVKQATGKIPLLGVCLGHQAIGQAFGGRIVRAQIPVHGKTSDIFHDGSSILKGFPVPFSATRYHSLLIEKQTFPECLDIIARSEQDEIMAITHRSFPTTIGVQFHPESIMTPVGRDLLRAFIAL